MCSGVISESYLLSANLAHRHRVLINTAKPPSKQTGTIKLPSTVSVNFCFSPPSNYLLDISGYLRTKKWYLVIFLFCISLIISEVGHLFPLRGHLYCPLNEQCHHHSISKFSCFYLNIFLIDEF